MTPGDAAPMIARLSGLPCDVMEAFSTRLGERLEHRRQIEAALSQARAELADRLYEAVPAVAEDQRSLLLAVRRDCYNGRPLDRYLSRHQGMAGWQAVEQVVGAPVQRVVELERQLDAAARDFTSAYEEELRRQYGHLAALLEDPSFRCGLAVASPVVAGQAHRLRGKAPDGYGRRERRLASTVLRYASRAALKLSPFSTFTSVGLAELVPSEDGEAPLALVGSGWSRRSLVRLRRHLLDRCSDLLSRYPPWRERLTLALNDSALVLDDGRLLYHRPGHYQPDGEALKLRFHEESLVRAGLRGPLVERLKSLLAAEALTYGDAVPVLAGEMGGVQKLDRLIEMGYLQLLVPWSAEDGHLEKTMLRELSQLPAEPALERFLACLRELVELEDALFESADPAAALAEIEKRIAPLLRGAAALGGLKEEIDVAAQFSEHDVYQDLWCAPQGDGAAVIAPVLRLGRDWAEAALRSIEPLVRYSRLYDHKLDFLLTLGAALGESLGERLGERSELPLLDAFQRVQPLWQDFMKFQVASRAPGEDWRSTWNPLGLESLADLARWREAAGEGLSGCLIDGPQDRRISIEALESLLTEVPRCYTDGHGGACLFLQPASADGSLWMLNRVKEGTGRFASRYTPLMTPALRQRYAAELSARGTWEIGGEAVDLLDVQCVQGDTLNVHEPQTPKVLVFPGARSALPAERQRRLGDLVISLDGTGWPHLRDRGDLGGRRYLPVHLGVGYMDYMPTLVKFLCAFGPSEMGAVFPSPRVREAGGVTLQERTVIGNLVLHRRSWSFPVEDLRRRCDLPADPEVFAALHRLRAEHGLPGQVFALERVAHPVKGSRYRPQYLDLTSPLFVPLWRSILEAEDRSLILMEALPPVDLFPRDAQGRRWAVEILIDSLALRPEPEDGDAAGADLSRLILEPRARVGSLTERSLHVREGDE